MHKQYIEHLKKLDDMWLEVVNTNPNPAISYKCEIGKQLDLINTQKLMVIEAMLNSYGRTSRPMVDPLDKTTATEFERVFVQNFWDILA